MKTYIILLFNFLFLLSCGSPNSYEVFDDFDMYNLTSKGNSYSTFNFKPYFLIKKNNDSLFVSTKNTNCNNSEIYIKKSDSLWFSNEKIKGGTKGKYTIEFKETFKYIYNDTLLIYVNSGVKLNKLGYKPMFNSIEIRTKSINLIFYFPKFKKKKERLTKKEIVFLKKNCLTFIQENKTFINGNLYKDIETINSFKKTIKKETYYYELNGLSEYFLEIDKCNSFKKHKLIYGKRISPSGNGTPLAHE